MSILATLAKIIITGASAIGLIATPQVQNLGSAVPQSPALLDTYLASGIASTDTSLTLANGTLRNGQSISGNYCFVLDINQPTVEYVCGTASGTSVTSLIRGVDVLNPNTSSTALAYSHRRFASIQVSDYPTLQFLTRKANGTDSYDSVLKYNSSTVTNALIGVDPGNIASVAYVASTSFAGTVDASEIQKGIVELSTNVETQAGTSAGSTGARLVPPTSLFNSTSTATTIVPVTKTNGKLSQGFLDLTEAFTFSATTTFTGKIQTPLTLTTATSTATSTDQFNLLPAGVIQMYASSTAPNGWLLCDGSSYATSTYPRLFSVIGTVYGGSGSNFNVPDLRGRFVSGPSSTLSTTIGATGGSTSTNAVVTTRNSDTNGTGGGGSGVILFSGSTPAALTASGTVATIPPYIILNNIIKY